MSATDPIAAKAEDKQFSEIMLMIAGFTPAELTEILNAAIIIKTRKEAP